MFLGFRDIFFAKGRFILIAAVIGLLTLLLVMLTGLTGGLAKQNIAALEGLDAQRLVFSSSSKDPEVSFTSSTVSADVADQWKALDATPLGISQTKVEGKQSSSSAVFGIPQGSNLVVDDTGQASAGAIDLAGDSVVLAESVAQNAGLGIGDTATVSGISLKVTGIVPDTFYSHQPVTWVSTSTWQKVSHSQDALGTVLVVRSADSAAIDRLAQTSNTLAVSPKDALKGLPSYSSEQGSLKAMQGFLYGISALVTISFLTVWTIQRTRDLAVMRALGASTGYLVGDAMAQAALVLATGACTGLLTGWLLGTLAVTKLPFQLDVQTVLGPAAGIWVLGLMGSLAATFRVSRVNPMLALGGN